MFKVKKDRLLMSSGKGVTFDETPNKSGKLKGNKPKYVIIHYTAGGTAQGAINSFNNPKHKASAHIVLGHDGTVTQMAKLDEKCWHAGSSKWKGLSGLNSHSVGIEIVNWGWLKGEPGNWRAWTGRSVDDDRVIREAHRNDGVKRGWEIYDPIQVETCVEIVRAIADEYGLGPMEILGHDDISPGRKQDPGPAWDMDRFRGQVFGRDEDDGDAEMVLRVESATGLNMRTGPGVQHDKIKNLPDGTHVIQIEAQGAWRLVSEVVDGNSDETGWVHSNWLRQI